MAMKALHIELATLLPADSPKPPEVMHLADCSPVCVKPVAGYVQGFYGFQGKQQGMAAGGRYIQLQGRRPLAVSFEVKLARPIPRENTTLKNLADTDFVNLMRASRETIDFLADFWYDGLKTSGMSEKELSEIDWQYPSRFIGAGEFLLPKLLDQPTWAHLKLLAYPAKPQIASGEDFFMVGMTRKENIVSAHLQYDKSKILEL